MGIDRMMESNVVRGCPRKEEDAGQQNEQYRSRGCLGDQYHCFLDLVVQFGVEKCDHGSLKKPAHRECYLDFTSVTLLKEHESSYRGGEN